MSEQEMRDEYEQYKQDEAIAEMHQRETKNYRVHLFDDDAYYLDSITLDYLPSYGQTIKHVSGTWRIERVSNRGGNIDVLLPPISPTPTRIEWNQ
jgi:hypothetical protein